MKKILIFAIALFTAFACENNDDDSINVTLLSGEQFSLSEIEAYVYPSSDKWIITDTAVPSSSFAGLSAAIQYISSSDSTRQISLEFPNMEQFPAYAIFGDSTSDYSANFAALTSVSADVATVIGSYAFGNCTGLTYVDMPLIQKINSNALRNCSSLVSINTPLVTSIGSSAFLGCFNLVSAHMPLVTEVGASAFSNCYALQGVDMPLVESVGSGAFYYCSSLLTVSLPVATTIEESAFCNNFALESVSLPVVETIGDEAFASCGQLLSFTIPATTTSFGYGAINDCGSLLDVTVESDDYILVDGILYDSAQTTTVAALSSVVSGDVVLPETVLSVGKNSLRNCSNITTIEVPAATEISTRAFAYCTALSSATLSAATDVDSYAFAYCDAFTAGYMPQITSLGYRMFYECEKLDTLEIATDTDVMLSYVDDHAFEGAVLTKITMTVGAANADYVEFNHTLTVGDFSQTFNEIIILE